MCMLNGLKEEKMTSNLNWAPPEGIFPFIKLLELFFFFSGIKVGRLGSKAITFIDRYSREGRVG